MIHRRLAFLLLIALLALSVTPVAFAQDTSQLSGDLLARLAPRQGQNLLFDIMLYAIFFMSLITTALIPDKQLFPTLIMTAVMGMAVISKLEIFTPDNFGTLVLNAGMFTLPLIVAGLVRSRHGTPKAMAPSALTGLLGGGYFFLFWALVQRNIG